VIFRIVLLRHVDSAIISSVAFVAGLRGRQFDDNTRILLDLKSRIASNNVCARAFLLRRWPASTVKLRFRKLNSILCEPSAQHEILDKMRLQ
jgi:hypothetical protein